MIGWSSIVGQEDAVGRLRKLCKGERMPHALLFAGPESVGKYLAAKTLAAALLCESGDAPCGTCRSCRMVENESHPDLVVVRPDKQNIKIGEIRKMQKDLSLAPYMAERRVCIIDEADKMRDEAANSILKTLEEPVGDVVFILITAKRYQLLDTIRSRCMLVQFGSVPWDALASELVRRGANEKDAFLAARLAGGRFAPAEEILAEDGQSGRQAAIDLFFRMVTMSEKDIWQTASAWDMCERDEVLRRLGSLKLLVRDAMVYAADLDEQIINSDCLERFAQAKNVWSQRTLSLFMRELVKREQSVKNNGNIKLVIEAMLLAWRSMIQRR
ncbi:MAG: DNA polymerase III subunit delta' [Selenomonadales bacterium]|nr:DNA polymerase III subunit delta' [Selenomonadales bacterium]